ncbi:hypothetical protein Tco_0568953 [Tanacetum coccineum]
MPVGVEVDRSANSSIILVLVSLWRLSFSKMESGIRLMLAPRSARAKHSSNSGKSHGEHLRSNITMWRFRKISMNFKAKRSSFSRTFSLFTLDGYGKVVLVLGMTTGSSTWTIEVGTSFGILTEAPWSFVTVVPLPSPLRDVFLDIVTINVAIGGWTILNQCSNHIFRQQTSDEQLVVEDSYSLLKQSLASVIDELWTCLIDDY